MPPGVNPKLLFSFIIALCFGRDSTFTISAYKIKCILTNEKKMENLLIMCLEHISNSPLVNMLKKY